MLSAEICDSCERTRFYESFRILYIQLSHSASRLAVNSTILEPTSNRRFNDILSRLPICIRAKDVDLSWHTIHFQFHWVAELEPKINQYMKAGSYDFRAEKLRTRGCCVLVELNGIGKHLFCDEIEVHRGNHNPRRVKLPSETVELLTPRLPTKPALAKRLLRDLDALQR